ncbi:Basic region leucine zipper [Popillia japonica]|uniref:Basic region leucine zipper n=1 Tax=Popillia japonica TaxID=7064 RepID=A0AAW1ID51_POPJA
MLQTISTNNHTLQKNVLRTRLQLMTIYYELIRKIHQDTATIDDDILRIDSQDSSSRDYCDNCIVIQENNFSYATELSTSNEREYEVSCDNCIVIQENNFSYATELSTSNEREYEVSSSNSNDTIIEDVSIVRKNLNNYLLKSNTINKREAKTNVKEKIKEVLHNKRKGDIKPLDLKVKDSDNPKKLRQRVNLKSKLKNAIDLESKAIKIEFHRNVDLYDKNLNEVEKRRAMNRMAQMRSRKRKKMWLDQMEQEIEKLKTDNKLILTENQKLKDENIALKSMLLKHSSCSFSTKSNIQNGNIPVEPQIENKLLSIQPSPVLYNTYTVESSKLNFKAHQAMTAVKTNTVQIVQKPLPKLLPKRNISVNHTRRESTS